MGEGRGTAFPRPSPQIYFLPIDIFIFFDDI